MLINMRKGRIYIVFILNRNDCFFIEYMGKMYKFWEIFYVY